MKYLLNKDNVDLELNENSALIITNEPAWVYTLSGIEFAVFNKILTGKTVELIIEEFQILYTGDKLQISDDIYDYINSLVEARILLVKKDDF